MSERMADAPATGELRRSRSNRMLAGVAGGLGAYFELHPAVFRVSFVVLTLMGGAGILIYLTAALVMPDEGKEDSAAAAARGSLSCSAWSRSSCSRCSPRCPSGPRETRGRSS